MTQRVTEAREKLEHEQMQAEALIKARPALSFLTLSLTLTLSLRRDQP